MNLSAVRLAFSTDEQNERTERQRERRERRERENFLPADRRFPSFRECRKRPHEASFVNKQ